MVMEHGMAILSHNILRSEVKEMNFFIQANLPEHTMEYDSEDYNLSTAIETVFPLFTEDAFLIWNHVCIPLSYKYDISHMMDDILEMLKSIRTNVEREMVIEWSSDTFFSTWHMKWGKENLSIDADWKSVVGGTKEILNKKNKITINKVEFANEWKRILHNVIKALLGSGYTKELQGMESLMDEFELITQYGILYKNEKPTQINEVYSSLTGNSELSKSFDWGNTKCEETYGETFIKHGSHHKITHLMTKAKTEGYQFGQWTDNQRAAEFIAEVVEKKGTGIHDVPLPSSAIDKFPSVVYLDTGLKSNADMARVIVNSDGSVKVAYPFNSRQPH